MVQRAGYKVLFDQDAVAWTESLVRDLAVPGLSRWGATEADVPALVAKARAASSMKGNPVALEEGELVEIARASLSPTPGSARSTASRPRSAASSTRPTGPPVPPSSRPCCA